MERDAHLPVTLMRWADHLRSRGLGDVAGVAVDLLRAWGFVGSQILWMVTPLFGAETLAPVAEGLENPEALKALRAYLAEDTPVSGSIKGE